MYFYIQLRVVQKFSPRQPQQSVFLEICPLESNRKQCNSICATDKHNLTFGKSNLKHSRSGNFKIILQRVLFFVITYASST